MCGICGIVRHSGSVDLSTLEAMASTLVHRGPDAAGFYLSPPDREPRVGFGFRRLSIIDLAGGDQPIANEDETVWIVFNGEIYNFPELRAELTGRGHRFRTHADTEVIVHLYEELGPRCVERLNGMFAFALWDERERRLVLARDRFGKKPLYYTESADGLLFASELKALLRHPACPRDVDHVALSQYLAHEYIPAPLSIFDGVFKLPRAHVLTWSSTGGSSAECYWRLAFEPDDPPRPETEYEEEFRELLWSATRRRLLSDVPLGAFLSGGVDSSSVVAAMSELLPAGRVKTFSIGFEDASFDESHHARAVARHFGTEHHEEVFTPSVMLDLLPTVAAYLDEPLADPSVLPTYLLSRFTRQHVTVALGGDGSDELLAGYPTFVAERAARYYRVPAPLHRTLERLADRLPVSTANFSLDFKVKRFLRGMEYPGELRHAAWLGAFTPHEQLRLLVDPEAGAFAAARRSADAATGDVVARLIQFYVDGYLQDDILTKVDRASMACSLEVRAPFLDVDLAEFLGRVPSRLKLRRLETKHLLKRAMAGRLPDGIATRTKKGFGIPVAEWLKHELRDAVTDALSPARLTQQGLFRPQEVERLLREHLSGRRDNRKQLWTLFCFQLWYEAYVKPSTSEPTGVTADGLTILGHRGHR